MPAIIEKKRYGDITVHYVNSPVCQTVFCEHCGYAARDQYDFRCYEQYGACGTCSSTFYREIKSSEKQKLNTIVDPEVWKEYISKRKCEKSV